MKQPYHSRILAWVLVAIFISISTFSLSACSQDETTGPSDSTTAGSNTNGTNTAPTSLEDAQAKPETAFQAYAEAWQKLDYPAMYELLSTASRERITEEDFNTRYKNIMSGTEVKSLEVKPGKLVALPESNTADMAFSVVFDFLAGKKEITDFNLHLVKETDAGKAAWRVDWTETLIFPKLGPKDKVRAKVLQPLRGEIRDRNGLPLAVNGQLRIIGLVPRTFTPEKATSIPKMAEMLGIAASRIEKALSSAGSPDWFIPIVTLPADRGDLSAQLTALPGVQYQNTDGRVYPAGIAAGLLTGYIGPITAEELQKNPDQGYTATDKIGKLGLELALEPRLRGKRGGEITIIDGETNQTTSIVARQEPVNGESIRLSIDLNAQNRLYQELGTDAGAAAAIVPKTGEILALVSTPSFDPNHYQTYIPDAVRAEWNNAAKSPFLARFRSGYSPGSTFKLVTTGIGLKTGTLNPEEALPINGLQWQPNNSWGSYKVTRVKDIGRPVNLKDALVYSDNIYFAQQALRTGAEAYTKGAADFGIGEALPLEFSFYRSQLANQGLGSEILLADTGYGQGEVLISPLQMAMIYGALGANGDIMKPVLEIKGEFAPEVWKSQAIAAKDVGMLTEYLRLAVESSAGTGYTRPGAKVAMLGKTGTAELKKSAADTSAQENGWFIAMNVNEPRLAIAMLVEDVKGRGGSHYVVPKVKNAMDDLIG